MKFSPLSLRRSPLAFKLHHQRSQPRKLRLLDPLPTLTSPLPRSNPRNPTCFSPAYQLRSSMKEQAASSPLHAWSRDCRNSSMRSLYGGRGKPFPRAAGGTSRGPKMGRDRLLFASRILHINIFEYHFGPLGLGNDFGSWLNSIVDPGGLDAALSVEISHSNTVMLLGLQSEGDVFSGLGFTQNLFRGKAATLDSWIRDFSVIKLDPILLPLRYVLLAARARAIGFGVASI